MKYEVGIVVPPINNFKGCIEMLDTVKTKRPYKIYIIDQWIHQSRPLSEAWNKGFDMARADGCKYIFILNDDILFAPSSIDNLCKEYDRLQKDGVVLVSCNNIMGQLPDPYAIRNHEQPYEVPLEVADHPNFSAFMVGSDFFDKCGRFDENFKPAWWEDNDMHYRITLLGYRAICTVASSCVHFGGVATSMLASDKKDSSRSAMYFGKKWGSANRNMNENYKTPYNDPTLTPKDWRPNYE